MKLVLKAAIFVGLGLVVGYTVEHDLRERSEWSGWLYPDANNLSAKFQLGNFASLSACRAAALGMMSLSGQLRDEDDELIVSDYECGRACKPHPQFTGIKVCSQTER